ncbi:MAG: hypothetical protein COW71_01785 [Ignavibacteriales bacterium CG18_big_fil_WC_8_21_14_2_50_31_20]|nr:MAG: hypothetical protein COW71_01785 [Ignavibacteriales bacterium CG18_big_fil_WC_8_21_14_2_50_31_20]
MLEKIATAIIIIIAFIMVTVAIAYLNLKYNNVFAFDFTPAHQAVELRTEKQISELKESLRPEIEKSVFDSLKVIGFDSTAIMNANNRLVLLEDSIEVLQDRIAKLSNEKLALEAIKADNERKSESNEEYKKWIAETSKFYESMESAKAAKIILKYSDNIAKDILYSMKKKKAAEILAEINPEIAKRITRVP